MSLCPEPDTEYLRHMRRYFLHFSLSVNYWRSTGLTGGRPIDHLWRHGQEGVLTTNKQVEGVVWDSRKSCHSHRKSRSVGSLKVLWTDHPVVENLIWGGRNMSDFHPTIKVRESILVKRRRTTGYNYSLSPTYLLRQSSNFKCRYDTGLTTCLHTSVAYL